MLMLLMMMMVEEELLCLLQSWLCDVEKNMRVTLKEELKKCKVNLRKLLNKRDKWIKEHPGQVAHYISINHSLA